ncbi:unnamed protein product, partial [Porites lobata]
SDTNECTDYSPSCHVNAVCQNTVGSHTCSCKDGKQCHGKNNINECTTNSHSCDVNDCTSLK